MGSKRLILGQVTAISCIIVSSASNPYLLQSVNARQNSFSPSVIRSDVKKDTEQSTETKKTAEGATTPEDPSQGLMRIKILQLLEEVAESTDKWENAEVAAKIETRIADMIWDMEPVTAQKYLAKAWERTSDIKPPKQERSRYRNESSKNNVRQAVLLVARKRAPGLAADWLKQITDEEEKSRSEGNRGVFDDRSTRSTVLLQMAMATVEENPSSAADLAIESLQDGVSFGLQAVLIALQAKDSDLAQKVVRAALARVRATGGADPSELLILYSYFYTPGQITAPNSTL